MRVRKGDTVEVISGNDRGRSGEVKQSFPREGRLLVEGVNMRWKHRRPNQQNPKGERVQVEARIHVSNVRLAPQQPTKRKAARRKA